MVGMSKMDADGDLYAARVHCTVLAFINFGSDSLWRGKSVSSYVASIWFPLLGAISETTQSFCWHNISMDVPTANQNIEL